MIKRLIKRNIKLEVLKNREKSLKVVVGSVLLATLILFNATSCGIVPNIENEIVNAENQPDEINETNQNENKDIDYSKLNFEAMEFGEKHYLTLSKGDMLSLIRKAINEVDAEYLNNGNKTVFAEGDNKYSHFDEYDILSMMETESSLRLVQLKDPEQLYNINNYERFNGEHKGVKYNGLGMMDSQTITYLCETDRREVNKFNDYENLPVGNTKIEMKFENLNPYDYLKSTKPKTENEIKQRLAENIMFTTKCSYIYLNRIVKDNVKKGTHDEGYNAIINCSQLSEFSNEEKQKFFALLGYNQGPNTTYSSLMSKTLFDKELNGENINNINYPIKVMNHANQFRNQELTYSK